VLERLLHLEALFTADATVDDDDRLLAAEQRADALFEIVECVAMLGEDDQLLVRRRGGWRDRGGTIGSRRFGNAVADGGRGEDFGEQAGQLAPLGIGAAAADCQRLDFQPFQGFDLDAQFGDRAGGGGLVENFFLGGSDFVVGCFVQVINVFAVEGRQ
jgi:hypothetical protein